MGEEHEQQGRHRAGRRGALAVAAVALVSIAGAVTFAVADIGGNGVINGCYKTQNGASYR